MRFSGPVKFSSLTWHVRVIGEYYDILFKGLLWMNSGGAISDANLMGTLVECVNMLLAIWAKSSLETNVNDLQENKQEKDL